MALHVVWEKCSVDNRDSGAVVVLNRGDELPDFVDPFVRSTLVQIGAVRDFGAAVAVVQEAADQELRGTREVPPPVLPDEIPPADAYPAPAQSRRADSTPVEVPGNTPAERPQISDNKETWERYAVARGHFDKAEAESMTKARLVAEVTKRETA